MMRDHLDDTIARGEPLAALWASESSIYGRFGFGVATEHDEIEIDRAYITVSGDGGATRLIDEGEARRVFPPIYDAMRSGTPGMLTRNPAWWKIEVFFDPEKRRDGHTAQRYLLHETDGVPDGYAIYRQKGDWSDGFPNGTVKVREVVTASAVAHTGIWRYLTGIDLFPKVRWENMPIGDPLRWKVPDHRRIRRKRWDALHVRILDVPAALGSRTYGFDGTIRIAVRDPFLPEIGGTFELDVEVGVGRCRRVETDETDVELNTGELASLFLGAGDAIAMTEAGLISGDRTSIVMLGRMFRGDVTPWCEEVF
jgi:predicted acetyltransferase